MALDLSAYTATTDSPELAAFKQKVEKVAKEYAKEHGWCDVVNRALLDMGIRPERPVNIKVTTVHGFNFTVNILPSVLIGLDDAAQKQKVCDTVGEIRLSVLGSFASSIRLTPDMITDMALTSAVEGGVAPEWYYTSDAGRVLHRFPNVNPDRPNRTIYADCGESSTASLITQNSPRGMGTRCRKCLGRVTGGPILAA